MNNRINFYWTPETIIDQLVNQYKEKQKKMIILNKWICPLKQQQQQHIPSECWGARWNKNRNSNKNIIMRHQKKSYDWWLNKEKQLLLVRTSKLRYDIILQGLPLNISAMLLARL